MEYHFWSFCRTCWAFSSQSVVPGGMSVPYGLFPSEHQQSSYAQHPLFLQQQQQQQQQSAAAAHNFQRYFAGPGSGC